MKKKKLTMCILFFMMLITLMAVGCKASEKPDPNDMVQDQDEVDRYIEEENQRRQNDKGYQQVVKAESIADTLVNQDGVYDATVVLYNSNALVGIDVLEDSKGKIPQDMRDRITNIVKTFDNEIKNVTITSNKDLFNNIDDLEQSLIKGDANRDIREDIDVIIKKIK